MMNNGIRKLGTQELRNYPPPKEEAGGNEGHIAGIFLKQKIRMPPSPYFREVKPHGKADVYG